MAVLNNGSGLLALLTGGITGFQRGQTEQTNDKILAAQRAQQMAYQNGQLANDQAKTADDIKYHAGMLQNGANRDTNLANKAEGGYIANLVNRLGTGDLTPEGYAHAVGVGAHIYKYDPAQYALPDTGTPPATPSVLAAPAGLSGGTVPALPDFSRPAPATGNPFVGPKGAAGIIKNQGQAAVDAAHLPVLASQAVVNGARANNLDANTAQVAPNAHEKRLLQGAQAGRANMDTRTLPGVRAAEQKYLGSGTAKNNTTTKTIIPLANSVIDYRKTMGAAATTNAQNGTARVGIAQQNANTAAGRARALSQSGNPQDKQLGQYISGLNAREAKLMAANQAQDALMHSVRDNGNADDADKTNAATSRNTNIAANNAELTKVRAERDRVSALRFPSTAVPAAVDPSPSGAYWLSPGKTVDTQGNVRPLPPMTGGTSVPYAPPLPGARYTPPHGAAPAPHHSATQTRHRQTGQFAKTFAYKGKPVTYTVRP